MAYVALLLWSAICIVPAYWVVLASFKAEDDIIHGPRYLFFVDFWPKLDAWRFILFDSSENLLRPLWNSFAVSAGGTLLATASACMLLYAITRQPFKHGNAVLGAVLATCILPPVTVVIPLYMMLKYIGLLDTQAALALTYGAINLPVALWLLLPVFGPSTTEQEESAMLEGASRFLVLWDILLPMLAKGVAAVLIVVFILCWNEYLLAAYLTTDHASTLTPWMVGQLSIKEAQVGSEAEEWAHLSAATVLMAAPLLLFSVAVMRLISRSITTK